MDGFIYVLCPYTHPNPRIRQWRVDTCAMYCAALRRTGAHPYAPIVECHPVEAFLPGDCGAVEHWAEYNYIMLRRSNEARILPLWGFNKSRGIAIEVARAQEHNILLTTDYDWEQTIGEALS